jgi:hypothetical protein
MGSLFDDPPFVTLLIGKSADFNAPRFLALLKPHWDTHSGLIAFLVVASNGG